MHVYIKSEPTLWTVGFYRPDGGWEPESDHGSSEEAAARVAWLNGGQAPEPKEEERLRAELEDARRWIVGTKREVLKVARMQWDKEAGMGGDVQQELHLILGMWHDGNPHEVEIAEDGTVVGAPHVVEPDGLECRCAVSVDHDEF